MVPQPESEWALAGKYPENALLLLPNCLKTSLCQAAAFCTTLVQKQINAIGSRKHLKLAMLFVPLQSSFSVEVQFFYEKFPRISANYKMPVWKVLNRWLKFNIIRRNWKARLPMKTVRNKINYCKLKKPQTPKCFNF